jgi:hypothetical protein
VPSSRATSNATNGIGFAAILLVLCCGAFYLRRTGKAVGDDPGVRRAGRTSAAPTANASSIAYPTAPWGAARFESMTAALAARGIRYEVRNGFLVADSASAQLIEAIIAESIAGVPADESPRPR